MTEFVEVAQTTDVAESSLRKITVGSHTLLLARSGDRFYCTDTACPHLGGDLSEGVLDGSVITCPVHHSKFNLMTGEVIRWTDLSGTLLAIAKKQRPPHALKMYPVRIEGRKILVGL